jgi:hypothetical protein
MNYAVYCKKKKCVLHLIQSQWKIKNCQFRSLFYEKPVQWFNRWVNKILVIIICVCIFNDFILFRLFLKYNFSIFKNSKKQFLILRNDDILKKKSKGLHFQWL